MHVRTEAGSGGTFPVHIAPASPPRPLATLRVGTESGSGGSFRVHIYIKTPGTDAVEPFLLYSG